MKIILKVENVEDFKDVKRLVIKREKYQIISFAGCTDLMNRLEKYTGVWHTSELNEILVSILKEIFNNPTSDKLYVLILLKMLLTINVTNISKYLTFDSSDLNYQTFNTNCYLPEISYKKQRYNKQTILILGDTLGITLKDLCLTFKNYELLKFLPVPAIEILFKYYAPLDVVKTAFKIIVKYNHIFQLDKSKINEIIMMLL